MEINKNFPKLSLSKISSFIKTYLPRKDDWVSIKNRIICENERVKFLTKISVDISIKTQEITFALPEFGLTNKETIIEDNVWQQYSSELVAGKEVWGIVELGYRSPDAYDISWEDNKTGTKAKGGKQGKIKLTKFTNFCPYTIDTDFYKDIRNEFTTQEWVDVVLGAIDYNADGYDNDKSKLAMIARLLPFVEKRINLIELAPKGTGKSYLFGRISKYGNLTAGVRKPGIMSISFPGRDGEQLLHRLDLKGIMISTGAACDSVNTQISHVLSALDMDESVAKGTIRISLSKDNTEDEAHRLGQALCKILQ